jgi:hypothetical protein
MFAASTAVLPLMILSSHFGMMILGDATPVPALLKFCQNPLTRGDASNRVQTPRRHHQR